MAQHYDIWHGMKRYQFMWNGHLVLSIYESAEAIDKANADMLAECSKNNMPYYPYTPLMVMSLGE